MGIFLLSRRASACGQAAFCAIATPHAASAQRLVVRSRGSILILQLLAKVRIYLTVSLTYAAPLDPDLSGFEFKVRGSFGYGIPLKIVRRRRWDASVQARAARVAGLGTRT